MNTGIDTIRAGFLTSNVVIFTNNSKRNAIFQLIIPPTVRFTNAGGAAYAFDLVKVASGTAVSGGTSMLSATVALTGAADTNVDGSPSTTAANLQLGPGQSIGIKLSGTAGGFVAGSVTFGIRRIAGLL